jgi:hypothetical protein
MFILYALVAGLVLGIAWGGRPKGLGALTFRWPWVFLAGLVVQLVLFSDAVAERVGGLGPPIYVGSTAVVFVAVLANRAITGMKIVALGSLSNLLAILANGGYMPASAAALQALGWLPETVYSNSAVLPNPALQPLTDIFVLPSWLPGANVFSIGDVLIGLGVVVVIVAAMRRDPASPSVRGPGAELAGAPRNLPRMAADDRTYGG